MAARPDPGWSRFQCLNFVNCGQLVRVANSYCSQCTARGFERDQDNVYSGLTSEAPGVGMPLVECGITSRIPAFTSVANYYDCSNGCGRKVRVMNTMCSSCTAGIGPPFNNQDYLGSGLAHSVSGVNIPGVEYGTLYGTQGTNDHASAAYPCRNPGCSYNVQERGDLCQVCVAGA